MYRRCIFCSAALGGNEVFEHFPVGRSIAFDATRGRLWAVCGACGRWNLAPIEERWETVDEAEKRFRDARVRVQSERIGLTKLRDGTRLIRIGEALTGEIAALRYGSGLRRRRRAHLAGLGAVAGGGIALVTSAPLLLAAGVPLAGVSLSLQVLGAWHDYRRRERIVHHIAAADSPTGTALPVRRRHLYTATLLRDEATDEPRITLPPEVVTDTLDARAARDAPAEIAVCGRTAERIVARAITDYNVRGASGEQVRSALDRIVAHGDAAGYVRAISSHPIALTRPMLGRVGRSKPYTPRQILGTFRGEILPVTRYASPFMPDQKGRALQRIEALALEIALHEEAERRALQGELAALELAWREAEEIAAIADALVVDFADRLRALRGR